MGGRYATLACGVLGVGATGLPIGLFCEPSHGVETLGLAPGDSLVRVTDGATEARNREGEEYGLQRLSRRVAAGAALRPADLLAACVRDVSAFRAGTPPSDDLTILVARREG